jgi:murein DD-endopeptidase MepM/ murein hydrolase activator NlpD
MSNHPNNRKESAFLQKLKQIRVNRAVYLCAIVVLIALSVVLAITAIANRAKNEPPIDTPTDTTVKVPSDTQHPPLDSEPTYNGIPELALPVSGTLSKKHSVDTQVFSPTMNDYRVHLGIDIATEEAAPVCAVAEGTVAQVWEDPMMGWCVAISHAGDCVTVYKNLAKQLLTSNPIASSIW